jgi:two-component system LytT family response regulator
MSQSSIRALIADDEEPARELLRALLSPWQDIEIVAEAGDGVTALEAIRALRPDVVFLDVKMPGMSGIEMIEALEPDALPLVVFVTAYDEFAVKAFEVSAFDYLLKPFEAARLRRTMTRVVARIREADRHERPAVETLLRAVRSGPAAQLVVKTDGRHLFLDPTEVERIEADGKHARIHLLGDGGKTTAILVRETLQNLESRLDPEVFVRVHRSSVVNRRQIREIQPWFKGDFVIIMRRGTKVVTGRTYREVITTLLR